MELIAPVRWKQIQLKEIFTKKNEKVGDRDIKPFSCTNIGVVPREEKFDKSLAASLEKNKVAELGDFVFGMSREILNFGMMNEGLGCFSPAYKIYSIKSYNYAKFLEKFMRVNHDYYFQAVTGGAREGKSLSENALFELYAPVPDQDELKEISKVIDTFGARIVELRNAIKMTEQASSSILLGLFSETLCFNETSTKNRAS